MNILQKTLHLLKKEGISSFFYVAGQKLKNRRPDNEKYALWQKVRRREREDLGQVQQRTVARLQWDESLADRAKTCQASLAWIYTEGYEPEELPEIFWNYMEEHPAWKFVYGDEDYPGADGREPYFKPDWSPDTYRSFDYIGPCFLVKTALLRKALDREPGLAGQGLYALGRYITEQLAPEEIGHVPEILSHRKTNRWQETVSGDPHGSGPVFSTGHNAVRSVGQAWTCPVYPLPEDKPLVTIVIPSKDHAELLEQCVRSVEAHTTYPAYEWVVVDNGSGAAQKARYEQLCGSTKQPCHYVYAPAPFNFSAMCNAGAAAGNGTLYLFLNDDMELPEESAGWLEILAGQALQAHTGAVGARLRYPGSAMIQHVGVVNYTSGAAHILWQADDSGVLPEYRNRAVYDYLIVTGACMMVEKEKFRQAGGFDEALAVTFNDVDLCLKLWENGYYQVVRNDVLLYHHESLSRGQDVLDEEKFLRGLKEREVLFDRHPAWIGIDPFYSPHRTQKRLDNGLDPAAYLPLSRLRATGVLGAPAGEGQVRYRILRVRRAGGEVRIEGWAYAAHKRRAGKVTLVLTDGKGRRYLCATERVYDPTVTTEAATGQKLNFAGFTCRVAETELQAAGGGPWTLGISVSGLYAADVGELPID